MDLKLSSDIDLNIDGELFNVSVRRLSKKEQKSLKSEGKSKELKTLLKVEEEILNINEKIDRYKALFKEANSFDDKKEQNSKIEALELELEKLPNSDKVSQIESISQSLEQMAKNRFELTVTGESVESLKSVMDSKSISYIELLEIIDEKIRVSEEGK